MIILFKNLLHLGAFVALLGGAAPAQLNIQAVDVSGDSISKGFNAGNQFPCANADQEPFNWMTSDTHGTNLCGRGADNVFSFVERLECEFNTNIIGANPNRAVSGARMLSDFVTQANGIRTFLNGQPFPRLAAVFLGHNDGCSTTLTRTNATCATADQDPNNYCRTRNDSFEREFRKGLDVLITVANAHRGRVPRSRFAALQFRQQGKLPAHRQLHVSVEQRQHLRLADAGMLGCPGHRRLQRDEGVPRDPEACNR